MSTCNFCGWYGGGHSDECAKMQQRIKELEADKEAQRTKFNAEWNTLQEQINIAYKDVARLEAERDALQVENEKIKVQREEAWQAFTRLRKAYSMVRYPTLAEELRLLYDTADAVAAGKTKEG